MLFILWFPSFLKCHSNNFMRILLMLSKYILSQDIHFHRMTIYLEVLLIDPWACLHMLGRSTDSHTKENNVSSAGNFMFPMQCVFGLPLPPTVHTDYFAANAWHAVRIVEIRHDTWDRREDIPGRKASKTTQKINSNQTLLWSWNHMLWMSGETIVCCDFFFFFVFRSKFSEN